ncbi:hypothetical protein EVA_06135 [gut metagenome]|uniref:Uncharacterized protein n=1 Tax=gut metagenome TaxID=749906 RepID=J9GY59_9ZZZZ
MTLVTRGIRSHFNTHLLQTLFQRNIHIRRNNSQLHFIKTYSPVRLSLKIACTHMLNVLHDVRYFLSSLHRNSRIKLFQVFVYALGRM